ncbi:hypothetical protein Q7P37_011328 [Cladosporium fusiforme]
MDTASLYNQERFSDLTLKLSNGVAIKVHKVILCSKSEYFNMLCGPESRFAERNQAIIELKEDDPEALEALIRHLYSTHKAADPLQAIKRNRSWRFWLTVRTTADKYLEPSLNDLASQAFRIILSEKSADANNLAEIIMAIQSFCEWLSGETEIMMRMLKAFSSGRQG